jgi:hypothetical protein
MKENEISGERGTHGKVENKYRTLVGKTGGVEPGGRPRRRRRKIILKGNLRK